MTYRKLKKIVLIALSGVLLFPTESVFAGEETTFKVDERYISTGYISHRIELKEYVKPVVTIKHVAWKQVDKVPDEVVPRDANNFDILLGKERKRPFAVVRIPAFSMAGDGSLRQITEVTIEVEEQTSGAADKDDHRAAAKTTAANSPLATGTWYKIAVSSTGLHKIDYNFVVNSLGVNPSDINSDHIRIFGYGGHMLPEKNSTEPVKGLTENAIWVNDGGDGSFGPGDYIVFYAQGPVFWKADLTEAKLVREKNYYEDKGYYFINFDGPMGKRISQQTNPPAGNVNVTAYNKGVLYEQDINNPQKFGKHWWGEEFSNAPGKQTSYTIQMALGDVVDSTEYRISLTNTTQSPSNFDIALNGQPMGSYEMEGANRHEYDRKVFGREIVWRLANSGGNVNLKFDYTQGSNEGSGYLDYVSANLRKPLRMEGSAITFTDLQSVGAGKVASYAVAGAAGGIQVWDVTDPQNPVRMQGQMNGNTYSFTQDASTLHRFAAMNDANLPGPEAIGAIPNQNLYGAGQVDYIIVTYPEFLGAAENLANFHRDRTGMRVIVATTTQVYNEFSSGGQDISAIRNMARMFYERAGMNTDEMPRYLLLFGDASYDYKNRVANNTNFVPTFEAEESFDFLATYSNDDFFGFLDDNEDIESYSNGIVNTLDIGIGRLPVKSAGEANEVVNKITHYKSPATLGAWRLSNMYIADNEDGAGEHLSDAETMEGVVTENSQIHNSTKVYEDAIPFISTPGGQRAPEANKMINDGIFKGLFMINYCGHGNTSVLSHERILTKDDYNKWRNIDKMPFMITATCDFGQFDQPSFVSSGEQLMLKSDGGVIATLTTTHLVYAYANEILNKEFLRAQFTHENGRWNTFGDAMRIGKNGTYGNSSSSKDLIVNFRKFCLLGDPALEPNFPQYFISTESITDGASGLPTSTIGALGEYVINGKVTDVNGNVLTDFNGGLSVTIFDKPRKVKTITGINKTFLVRNNIIYKGKATVTDGKFSFAFIAPKDINYEVGKGRISYYADNGVTDAAGRDTSTSVGGFSDNPIIENDPPVVKAFIKDSLFRNGGLTGSNTALFAILEDETGINVSGNSVGHDLTAVLDEDVSNPYVMNDYYETAPNTYKRGYVYFPLENLEEGRHRLTVKAWDVNNNSGEGYVDFEVLNGNIVKVQNLMNYPNPFRDVTHFVFEHNHPDEDLTAEINIYNTSGVFVRKLRQNFISTGSKSNEIVWDGTDNGGVRLPSGVYIYRMSISTDAGIENTAYQKLVIVR